MALPFFAAGGSDPYSGIASQMLRSEEADRAAQAQDFAQAFQAAQMRNEQSRNVANLIANLVQNQQASRERAAKMAMDAEQLQQQREQFRQQMEQSKRRTDLEEATGRRYEDRADAAEAANQFKAAQMLVEDSRGAVPMDTIKANFPKLKTPHIAVLDEMIKAVTQNRSAEERSALAMSDVINREAALKRNIQKLTEAQGATTELPQSYLNPVNWFNRTAGTRDLANENYAKLLARAQALEKVLGPQAQSFLKSRQASELLIPGERPGEYVPNIPITGGRAPMSAPPPVIPTAPTISGEADRKRLIWQMYLQRRRTFPQESEEQSLATARSAFQ